MSNFKVSKKDAISDSRSTVNDLHERKMDFFEEEFKKLDKSSFMFGYSSAISFALSLM